MKQIKILLAGFAAMAISFVSCTNDFESANANPNELNEINPEYLFNTSSYYTLNAFCGSMKKVLLANYSHYYGGATGGQVQRYGNQGSTNDSYWKNVYNYAIFPVHFIQTQMENDEQYHNRVLIAKIWENYLFSQAVSIWGGIPKSQAFNAGERVPYDKESDIYYAMLNDLKACADGLKMDGDVYKADPIFPSGQKSSDLLKWKKFANSLRLRLAVRICNADRSKATEVIDELMEKEGFEVTLLPVHENGIVVPEELEAAIREDTCLVTIMTANNEIGTIQPVKEIGEICKKHNILFHTDAVQAAGHIHIDVKDWNVDLMSVSAHKFHGPKGVGFLYARKGIALTNLIEGGAQEKGKRAGTENVPGIMAMAAALQEAVDHLDENAAHQTVLRDRLIRGLLEIPHSALNGDAEKRLPGNVNCCFEGIEGESLLLLLDDKGISASSGSACTSGSLDPSHVLLAIGRVHDVAHGSLRLSIGEEITEEETDYIIASVKEVVEYLRSFSPVWRDLQAGKTPFIL